MKKILLCLFILAATESFAQNTLTFLGIPIDGLKKEMIAKLEAKGYEYDQSSDALFGEFNGRQVFISIQTINNRVWRVCIIDTQKDDEANIKIRFNRLFKQLSNSPKYKLEYGSTLKDTDDISYEINVHNKRYDTYFVPTDQSIHGAVWYTIAEEYGKYRIAIFYENHDNAANGDDL